MSGLKIQNSRHLLKRTTTPLEVPTIPTGSTIHTDGTWNSNDIYAGELFLNMEEKQLWFGWEDISGNTGVSLVNPFGNLTGSCIDELFVSNVYGCSPINLWDNLIFQTGVTINSVDGFASIGTDLGGVGSLSLKYDDSITNLHSAIIDGTGIALSADDSSLLSSIQITPASVLLNSNLITLELDGNRIRTSRGSEEMYHTFGANGTLNATPIAIGTIDFNVVPDSVITVNADVNGVDLVNNDVYGAKLFAVFKNIGGTITQVGTTDKSEKSDFSTATSNITISGTNIIIEVIGEIGIGINWQTNFSYHITP